MTVYHVYANASEGYYEAGDLQGARDAFAQDAGYRDEADMERQLEEPSEIRAEPADAVIASALLKIEDAVSGSVLAQIALLARSVQDLGEAVTDVGEILASAAAGRTNGKGR
jgi:hypothetical protein